MLTVDKIISKLNSWKKSLIFSLNSIEERKIPEWENWNRTALKWENYASPFRPSGGDIKNYEEILKKIGIKKKILILGSTPELRDIVSGFDSNVIIADFSFSMVKGMLGFSKTANAYREKWIKTNWLSLDEFLKAGYFDVILGDLVLRNLNVQSQDEFLYKIRVLLGPNGHFITRIHFINEDVLESFPNDIMRNIFINFFDCDNLIIEDLITSRLFDRNTDFETKKINKKAFLDDINSYLRKLAHNDKEKIILKNILWKWGGKTSWTQQTRSEIDRLFANHFALNCTRVASDYLDAGYYPVYTLQKK